MNGFNEKGLPSYFSLIFTLYDKIVGNFKPHLMVPLVIVT